MKRNYIFVLSIILILAVAGCAAKPAETTTTTIATANETTSTTTSTTTTTLPPFQSLASGVSAYVVDTNTIYYMSDAPADAKLMSTSTADFTKKDVASGFGGSSVKNIAVDTDYIYFTHEKSAGNVKFVKVSKADGKVDEVFACAPNTLGKIFVDGDNVYILPSAGSFCRMKKVANFASDGNFRFGVTSAGQNMVVTNATVYFPDNLWIKKVTLAKFELGTLASDIPQSNILLDGVNVYWVSKNGGLYTIGTGTGAKKATVSAGINSKNIALDANSFYYVDSEAGAIKYLPRTSGGPNVFVKTDSVATELVVNGGYLYWLEGGNLKRKKI